MCATDVVSFVKIAIKIDKNISREKKSSATPEIKMAGLKSSSTFPLQSLP
jgi:hypothetical protein